VISDAMMPDMNGRELCQRARELGYENPVVILSAASPEELGWADVGTATAWLRKPFKPTELVKDIQRIASEHRKS
jgi:DNA-binding response OmpR family regulator